MNSPVRVDERAHRTACGDEARNPARPAAVRDRLQQLRLVHAEAITQRDGLPQQADLGGEQRVVGQLHRLARTERADVQDRVAVGGQHRPDPRDGVVGSADEQRHLRPRRCCADRR